MRKKEGNRAITQGQQVRVEEIFLQTNEQSSKHQVLRMAPTTIKNFHELDSGNLEIASKY